MTLRKLRNIAMRRPRYPKPQTSKLRTLNDQVNLLEDNCTAADVASVRTSILATWFPPAKGYQLRWNNTTDSIEVYAIRVAKRPNEKEITFNPAFMVRCYNGYSKYVPPLSDWPKVMEEIPQSVEFMRYRVKGKDFPTYGAIAYNETVRLCVFDRETRAMTPCGDWPGRYFVNLRKGPLPTYLDRVKAEFAQGWGYHYAYSNDGVCAGRNKTDRVRSKTEADLSLMGDGEDLDLAKVDEDGYLGDLEMVDNDNAEIEEEDSEVGRSESGLIGATV